MTADSLLSAQIARDFPNAAVTFSDLGSSGWGVEFGRTCEVGGFSRTASRGWMAVLDWTPEEGGDESEEVEGELELGVAQITAALEWAGEWLERCRKRADWRGVKEVGRLVRDLRERCAYDLD